MYVWESLGKQCMFGNPWGNNVCLGIPWETMYVWESLGEQCMFGIPEMKKWCSLVGQKSQGIQIIKIRVLKMPISPDAFLTKRSRTP
jgi:hypothetical protein